MTQTDYETDQIYVDINHWVIFIAWTFTELLIYFIILTERVMLIYCLYEFVSLINVILREKNQRVESLYFIYNNRLSEGNKDYAKYCLIEKIIKILHLYILIPYYAISIFIFTSLCIYIRVIHKWYEDALKLIDILIPWIVILVRLSVVNFSIIIILLLLVTVILLILLRKNHFEEYLNHRYHP